MEDLYEESINPTNFKLQKTIYVLCVVFKIINIVVAAVFLYFGMLMDLALLILCIPFVLSVALLQFLQTKIYYCVDCIFVSGSTRLIKVINYKRRKKIIIFDSNEVMQVGKASSESFARLYQGKTNKKIYASPNRIYDNAFYIYVNQNGVKYLIIIDCTENYLSHLVYFTGKKVIEKDYQ